MSGLVHTVDAVESESGREVAPSKRGPQLVARGLRLLAQHYAVTPYQRHYNIKGLPTISAREAETWHAVLTEAASLLDPSDGGDGVPVHAQASATPGSDQSLPSSIPNQKEMGL